MDTVTVAGRTVGRLGISVAELRVTGMWGEPADREAAVAAIRRAVDLGAGLLEVPFPFGPGADLVREAQVGPAVFLAARLTAPTRLDALVSRLGRPPDLVLAERDELDQARPWGLPLGVVGAEAEPGMVTVRGPYPPHPGLVEACEAAGVPYLAPDRRILAAGGLTIAVPAPRSVSEVERVLGEKGAIPPAAGPG